MAGNCFSFFVKGLLDDMSIAMAITTAISGCIKKFSVVGNSYNQAGSVKQGSNLQWSLRWLQEITGRKFPVVLPVDVSGPAGISES